MMTQVGNFLCQSVDKTHVSTSLNQYLFEFKIFKILQAIDERLV